MEKRRLGQDATSRSHPSGWGAWQFSQKANLIGRVWDSSAIEAHHRGGRHGAEGRDQLVRHRRDLRERQVGREPRRRPKSSA